MTPQPTTSAAVSSDGVDQSKVPLNLEGLQMAFHHVQMYVTATKPEAVYKQLEGCLNDLASRGSYDPFSGGMKFLDTTNALPARVEEGRVEWSKIAKSRGMDVLDPEQFSPAGQDVIEQIIVGFGWRVTAKHVGSSTRSYLVTSQDAQGVKFIITSPLNKTDTDMEIADTDSNEYEHFSLKNLERYKSVMAGRPGFAVLAFEVSSVEAIDGILSRYQKLHPKLALYNKIHKYTDVRKVDGPDGVKEVELGCMRVLDVFAYYEHEPNVSEADQGTVLRFVFRSGTFASKPGFGNPQGVLPGLVDVPHQFDGTSVPAYSDHWVSNVRSRQGFLQTLQDTVGFTPKVDFNAGVVAAGEAQIESTVTGNASSELSMNEAELLRNQTQVYLPINNALSSVGHVHGFLEEIGQGVQHLASRVSDLVAFIERVNNYREITGAGLSFLRIPRSYYGRLDVSDLTNAGAADAADATLAALQKSGLVNATGIVDLDATTDTVKAALGSAVIEQLGDKVDSVVAAVLHGRYSNMYKLLRDNLTPETYVQIVRNKILVDIQGGDILYQIFTCNVLLAKVGDESPFFEFIQRVCAETRNNKEDGDSSEAPEAKRAKTEECARKPIKPGCGGFGIRNFLTLFLSIEVSKAMDQLDSALSTGDEKSATIARNMIQAFTDQLDQSNPILTTISDAMTEEGRLRELAADAQVSVEEKKKLMSEAELKCAEKEAGNVELKALSERYNKIMATIKAGGVQVASS